MDGVVCQAADRDEYLERSLFRQNGARPIFYKTNQKCTFYVIYSKFGVEKW